MLNHKLNPISPNFIQEIRFVNVRFICQIGNIERMISKTQTVAQKVIHKSYTH